MTILHTTMLASVGKATTKAMIHYANQGGKTHVMTEMLLFFTVAVTVCTYLYVSRNYKLCGVPVALRTRKERIAACIPGVFGIITAVITLTLLSALT